MSLAFFITHMWLVPAFPLLGAAIAQIVARSRIGAVERAAVPHISVASLGASFICAFAALLQLDRVPAGRRVFETVLFEWIPSIGRAGPYETATVSIHFGFLVDPLAAVIAFMVTTMAVLIHLYAMGDGDIAGRRHEDFYSFFDLCVASMLTIVLANNLVVLFAGWAALTVFSYLLILFSTSDESSLKPARYMVLVNCCGDVALLVATVLVSSAIGSTRFVEMLSLTNGKSLGAGANVLIAAAILMVVAASIKAAQFPWHSWLAEAASGVPSVAALIQAVTLIPPGAFLLIRASPVLRLSSAALWIAALMGAASVVTAALTAIVENDLRKILACSAVAQIGFVFIMCGLGAFSGSAFHLVTLAIFQCALMLGAAVIIHSAGGESDIRRLGDLRRRIPLAYWTVLIGAVGICWVFPFAGFSAYDFVLGQASLSRFVLSIFGCALTLATAISMTRVFVLAFHDSNDASLGAAKKFEVRSLAGLSLTTLAGIAVMAGIGAWEMAAYFGHFVAEAIAMPNVAASLNTANSRYEIDLMLLSGLFVLLGVGAGLHLYFWRPYLPGKIAQRWSWMSALAADSYRTGEFFTSTLPAKIEKFSLAGLNFDSEIIDGVPMQAFARLAQSTSKTLNRFDDAVLSHSFETGAQIFRLSSFPARLLQTGVVQSYALLIVGGIVSFLGFVLLFRHGH